MPKNAQPTPYEVIDIAEALDGASRDDLIALLSASVDRVYILRAYSAWAAERIESALAYKTFSSYRRPFATTQIVLLTRMANGDADAVKLERRSDRVDAAARREGIQTQLRRTLPDIDTSGPTGKHENLRTGIGYVLRELLTLRQLAAYEAGVARAHDIPSGPKTVRNILNDVDTRLLALAKSTDPACIPDTTSDIDHKAALRSVGAEPTLTNHRILAEHGITL